MSTEHDKLIVKGIKVSSDIGLDHWDRTKLQPLILDVQYRSDICPAGESDLLTDSLSYSTLCKEVMKICEKGSYSTFLILGLNICKLLLTKYNGSVVKVKIEKPKGLLHAEACGIEISRSIEDFDNSTPIEQLDYLPADVLFIRRLRLNCIIGVHSWEREQKQAVLIDMNLYPGISTGKASKMHPYPYIVRSVTSLVENSKFKTVEALVTAVAKVAIIKCLVPKITVSVGKPSALRFADLAAAEITRDFNSFKDIKSYDNNFIYPLESNEHLAIIALGSNLEDKYKNILGAIQKLQARGCRLVNSSFLYQSKPMYVEDQPEFLNTTAMIATTYSPQELLVVLKEVEKEQGRTKTFENGPRVVDLDILFYDDLILETESLTIPHPRIAEREFVLRPLCDMASNWVHPVLNWSISQIFSNFILYKEENGGFVSELIKVLPLRDQLWNWDKETMIMGILNVTPDSFSDGGKYNNLDAAVKHAKQLIEDGAHILDIGGVSTRPGAAEVSEEEELNRVIPVIEALRKESVNIPISVDTFRSNVAAKAIEAGADLINDVSGGNRDPEMLKVMVKYNVPVCLMHMRGDSSTMQSLTNYNNDVVNQVKKEISILIENAISLSMLRWNIILDPGVGFAKTSEQSFELMRNLPLLVQDNFPYLVGPSRKSFLGKITNQPVPKLRSGSTGAACTALILAGAKVLRIHDVDELRDAIKVADALAQRPANRI
ncbi:Dihydropteroate synthase [Conidiobolus coronatus NRRL 28638]|uniref:Folic acid synthesis protein FOL1 n=1 Tax=Conidiobolus coronatus (strain ATCC 28846 / CBS 209.66 / NRRL 28638) TaxID=796925 RepID=A0A137P2Z7_CONC2|nr:Dihydropteroate synthase [Conidiobolus coronatus NRRL 28638]|eukprot:KXN69407.1 Dihydropteroate synthase [Conidiobolus coronatus NRRL 28638]